MCELGGGCWQAYVFGDGARLPQRQLGVGVDNDRDTAVGVYTGELGLLDLVPRDVLQSVGQAELLENHNNLPWVEGLAYEGVSFLLR